MESIEANNGASPTEMPSNYNEIKRMAEICILVMDRIKRRATIQLKPMRLASNAEARSYAMDALLWGRNQEIAARIAEELKAEAWTPENLDRARFGLSLGEDGKPRLASKASVNAEE